MAEERALAERTPAIRIDTQRWSIKDGVAVAENAQVLTDMPPAVITGITLTPKEE